MTVLILVCINYHSIQLFFALDKSYFVGIIFKAYREMRNNTGDLNMGTKVINAVVSPRPGDELEDPVEMTFEKNIVSNGIIFCVNFERPGN